MGKTYGLCSPHRIIISYAQKKHFVVQLPALVHTELLEPLSRRTVGMLYRAAKPVSRIQ